jgi:hypothetical protein
LPCLTPGCVEPLPTLPPLPAAFAPSAAATTPPVFALFAVPLLAAVPALPLLLGVRPEALPPPPPPPPPQAGSAISKTASINMHTFMIPSQTSAPLVQEISSWAGNSAVCMPS